MSRDVERFRAKLSVVYRAAGRPTLRDLFAWTDEARRAEEARTGSSITLRVPGRATLNDWIRGRSIPGPASSVFFELLVQALAERASSFLVPEYRPTTAAQWRQLLRSAQAGRGPVAPLPRPRRPSAGPQGATVPALAALPRVDGELPRVEQVTGRALLGIHEAVPLPVDAAGPTSAELPRYVARDTDGGLRAALASYRTEGGFALLVGEAASGKTRSAYEALRAVVPDWRLLMPADGAAVEALAEADLSGSVLWLDELHTCLTGPAALTAATVRRLLTDTAHPVILIGTLWRDSYDALRGREGDGAEILNLARLFDFTAFSAAEWERAGSVAGSDPRLARALTHRRDFSLPQALAGVPELLHRWAATDQPYGKALLTAAVTARRCGHPLTVPAKVLEALAPVFLTGRQLADAGPAWFAEALAWASAPVFRHTDIALLSPHAEVIGRTDGYRVSDVLAQHLDIHWGNTPPAAWDALLAAADPAAHHTIGVNAEHAGRHDTAHAAWQPAADRGDLRAMRDLGRLLLDQGDLEGARKLLTPVAETGVQIAAYNLALVHHRLGDLDTARRWWTRSARAGHVFSMISLGRLLYRLGERAEALAWARRAADFGGQPAMTCYACMLIAEGDAAAARPWLVRAAHGHWIPAQYLLGVQLHQEGDAEGAREWWTQAAERGLQPGHRVRRDSVHAMCALGALSQDQGDVALARNWFSRAAEAGSVEAMDALASAAEAGGDLDAAAAWWGRAAEAGHVRSMLLAGRLAVRRRDWETGRRWFTAAAQAGDQRGMTAIGLLLSGSGDLAGARAWWTQAAEQGTPSAISNLIRLLERSDAPADAQEAQRWQARLPSRDSASPPPH